MPRILEFLPLVRRSIDEIRAQVDTDANAGISPTDDAYTDTTPGGWFYDLTQPQLLEIERLWDYLGTEVPAAGLLPYAFGETLDDWGDALAVPRKDEVRAAGVVTFTANASGAMIATGTEVAVPSTSADEDAVTFATTASGNVAANGTLDLPVEAVDPGAAGNVPAGYIRLLLSPAANVIAVSNAVKATGGTEVESDEAYRDRLLVEFQGAQGSGTITDYQRMALAEPGVGFVTVEPIWNGPGTVRVTVTDPLNDPVSPAVVASLQARLDPVAGEGRGEAPIGHTVAVATPSGLAVVVTAAVAFMTGYSLDGAIPMRASITAALAGYVDRLPPGEDVVLNRVESLFFGVEGVYNVSGVKLNGAATDLAVSGTQVAQFATPTLT